MDVLYRLLASLLLSSALAGLALWRKALTAGGLALAWVLALVITYCGGAGAFLVLAAVFGFTILAGRLSKAVREPLERRLHKKTGRRDAAQIFCNVFTGAVMLALYALTGARGFLRAYGGAMAASLADSMASELGVLSRRRPLDLRTLRPAEPGLSGAVTLTGLGASLLGAAIVGALWGAFRGWDMFPAVAAAGFLAALGDSVLGALVQAKYRCPACLALTEKPVHCGVTGRLERGFSFVTNDGVNLCNNLIGAALAAALARR